MDDYSKQRSYIGHLSQLFDIKEYRLSGGRAEGTRAVDIDNGSGLCFTVLPDRCMDLGRVTFRGCNIAFLTPGGYAHPSYYDPHSTGWLKSFNGGLLTTCGLSNIGISTQENDEELPLHGTLSNTPAEHFSIHTQECGQTPEAVLTGTMRSACLFGDRLLLTRTIRCVYGDNRIHLEDTITNIGFSAAPLMRLYHMNIGYPLLDEDAQVFIPSRTVQPRNARAAEGLDAWNKMQPPTPGFEEQCYYHTLKTDPRGYAYYGVVQPKRKLGLFVGYDTAALDRFVEWKMMGLGDYVLGLEPANATLDGRADARANGSLKMLEAGASVSTRFTFHFVSGENEISHMKALQNQCQ